MGSEVNLEHICCTSRNLVLLYVPMIRWYGELIDQPLKNLSAILQRFNFNSIHVLVHAAVNLRRHDWSQMLPSRAHPRPEALEAYLQAEVRPKGDLHIRAKSRSDWATHATDESVTDPEPQHQPQSKHIVIARVVIAAGRIGEDRKDGRPSQHLSLTSRDPANLIF